MRTCLQGSIGDVAAYLDQVDLALIPGEAEIEELLRKRLTKSHIALRPLARGDSVRAGDVVTISGESSVPKFNRPSIKVTVGSGLYEQEIEAALVGMGVGESRRITAQNVPVTVVVLGALRKEVPPVSAALVVEQGLAGVDTVEQYRAHLTRELMRYTLGQFTHELVGKLAEEAEIDTLDEDDLDRVGLLEVEHLRSMLLAQKGLSVEEMTPQELKECVGFESLTAMVQGRRDWYATNLRQCLVMMSVLDIADDGEYDPTLQTGAHSQLFGRMVDYVAAELMRRKTQNGSTLR